MVARLSLVAPMKRAEVVDRQMVDIEVLPQSGVGHRVYVRPGPTYLCVDGSRLHQLRRRDQQQHLADAGCGADLVGVDTEQRRALRRVVYQHRPTHLVRRGDVFPTAHDCVMRRIWPEKYSA